MNRRQFIGQAGGAALLILASRSAFAGGGAPKPGSGEFVFLEAEQFADPGGWVLDQQSMDQMGSPYLLAHGLGVPVRDAVTSVRFPSAGTYRVWVRTRDWVAPWNAPGAPGKFQLLIDGKPLAETFGTKGADWHWHDGGFVKVGATAMVALHDLTGFEGRCDAVLFCKDKDFTPTNEAAALTKFRRSLLGLPEHPDEGGDFDLVVAGGGIAGTCAALSAARNGLNVALVQDRPVLGGNGSSEVRVWPEGNTAQKPYPRMGDIVSELLAVPDARRKLGYSKVSANAQGADLYGDPEKLALIRAESRITLLMEHRAIGVEMNAGKIVGVIAQNTRTARQIRLKGKLFADCTGDATVGYLSGADHEISKGPIMGMSNLWNLFNTGNPDEVLKCECEDKDALSSQLVQSGGVAPFPRCPWALDLSRTNFVGRGDKDKENPSKQLGDWKWESGYERNPITEIERVRDLNLRAMYGAWDTLKNVDTLYPSYRLGWAAFIAGKRESRRLLGDVLLKGEDLLAGTEFPDTAFPCTWSIDLHVPQKLKGFEGEEFLSDATAGKEGYKYKGPYWAPYRCLYSRNIPNLFMAGRDISVTREALGAVRVMRTCGMMGEIVGKAAWICIRHQTTPRGVYESQLQLLNELMNQPGKLRRDKIDGVLA